MRFVLPIIFITLIAIFFYIVSTGTKQSNDRLINGVLKLQEESYFEGQRDALNDDIRIDILRDCWIKSPWDQGKKPLSHRLCKE